MDDTFDQNEIINKPRIQYPIFDWKIKPEVLKKLKEIEIVNEYGCPQEIALDIDWITPECLKKNSPNLERINGCFTVEQLNSIGHLIVQHKFPNEIAIGSGENLLITYKQTEKGIIDVAANVVDTPIIVKSKGEK